MNYDANIEYEFYYNEAYARKHNPSLMGIGLSGGYGTIRHAMVKAVSLDDLKAAKGLFWALIMQSLVEAQSKYDDTEGLSLEEHLKCWFEYILDDPENELQTFIRPSSGSKSHWHILLTAFTGARGGP